MRNTTMFRITGLTLALVMLINCTACDYVIEVARNTRKSVKHEETSDEEMGRILNKIGMPSEKDNNVDSSDSEEDVSINNSIFVNLSGYDINSDKIFTIAENAFDNIEGFSENNWKDISYSIYNTDKEEAVAVNYLTGYKNDFSMLKEPGTYYIEIDNVGRSQDFIIEDNHFDNEIKSTLDSMKPGEAIDSTNIKAHMVNIADLIMTYAFYERNDSMESQIISLAYSELDKISNYIGEDGTLDNKLFADNSSKYMYSAVSALMAYYYMDIDQDYSKKTADIAKKAYLNINALEEDADKSGIKDYIDEKYWAAAELFRLYGDDLYKIDVNECMVDGVPIGFNEDDCGYYGSLAYMMSTYNADVKNSEAAMKSIINDAIFASRADYSNDLRDIKTVKTEALLTPVANSISKSVTYVKAAEEAYDYLSGMNPDGYDYYLDDVQSNNDTVKYGSKLFILHGLDSSYLADSE